MNRRAPWLSSVLLGLALAAGVHAQPAPPAAPLQFRDSAEDRRFHALVQELRCVKCQNQSLADSNAQIALDLRREVLLLMREGRSDEDIREYLVARYGEFVLYRPRLHGATWLLWLGPPLVLLGGAVAVVAVVRARRAAPVAAPLRDEPQEW